MRILISPNTTTIAVNNEEAARWNVDKILVYGTGIMSNLVGLPFSEDDKEVTIFIPTVLEEGNALAYDGVTMALKILFKTICQRQIGINIVLMGCEPIESFMMQYPYPNIMKIPGLTYGMFNCGIIARMKVPPCPIRQRMDYKPYIENLGLKKPLSFKSTHSLTNEWSLHKWNSFMDFPYLKEERGIEYLYFDYIKAVEKLHNVKDRKIKNNPNLLERISELKKREGKVLLIEDNKEWSIFFERFLAGSKIQLDSIGEDFRRLPVVEVLNRIKRKVGEYNPDVILLDFRLIEDRDAEEKFEKISGTLVLKELKGTFEAPGIAYGSQVLMFTATSRIENILRLKELNADGFILKEKPESYNGKGVTKDVIKELVSELEESLTRAEFLKPLNSGMDYLSGIVSRVDDKCPRLEETVNRVIQSVRALTQKNVLSIDVLKIVYLNLFSILETFKIGTQSLKDFIEGEASKICLASAVQSLWCDICGLRNCLAHGDYTGLRRKFKQYPDQTALLRAWSLNLISFINEFLKLYLR